MVRVLPAPSNLNPVVQESWLSCRQLSFPPGIEIKVPRGCFAAPPRTKDRHAKKGAALLTEVTVQLGFPTCIRVGRTVSVNQDLTEHLWVLLCPVRTIHGHLQHPGPNKSKKQAEALTCPVSVLLVPAVCRALVSD